MQRILTQKRVLESTGPLHISPASLSMESSAEAKNEDVGDKVRAMVNARKSANSTNASASGISVEIWRLISLWTISF